jgi:sugar O-acyltransferase (sialic acid O-acetyltransferase NeuD family)
VNVDIEPVDVLLWGAKGQALVVSRILSDAGHAIVALVDRDPAVTSPVPGVDVLAPDDLPAWAAARARDTAYLVSIGGTRGRDRIEVGTQLDALGMQPLTAVHDRAWVDATVSLGGGSQICAMAAVGVDVALGQHTIINTNASVDHGCLLGDGVHVMPGATIAGEVTIGTAATIGSNATVLPGLEIGDDAVIGAGAVVTRSVPSATTVIGSPARSLR